MVKLPLPTLPFIAAGAACAVALCVNSFLWMAISASGSAEADVPAATAAPATPAPMRVMLADRAPADTVRDAVVAESVAPMPPPAVLLALLRGTLAAVNQANVTGNYSVLRDLGAPSFREAQSAAALADQFRMWRERKLDFAAIMLLDAKLTAQPEVGADGRLRLKGFFPTAPLRVGFDLGFDAVGGHWRLATIGLDITDTAPAVAGADTAKPVAKPVASAVPPEAAPAKTAVASAIETARVRKVELPSEPAVLHAIPPAAVMPSPPATAVPSLRPLAVDRDIGIPTPPGDRPRG